MCESTFHLNLPSIILQLMLITRHSKKDREKTSSLSSHVEKNDLLSSKINLFLVNLANFFDLLLQLFFSHVFVDSIV